MDDVRTRPPSGETDAARSDDTLMVLVRAGDEMALRELYERHAPWLAARLRRLLPASAVEDVMQETFLAVWRGAGSYRQTGAVGAWLWGIGRRQAAQWARKHGRPTLALHLMGERPGTQDDPATTALDRVEIRQAFAALGSAGTANHELARQVLVEERPLADVAADFAIPEGTVKSRLHRIRRIMRAALTRETDG